MKCVASSALRTCLFVLVCFQSHFVMALRLQAAADVLGNPLCHKPGLQKKPLKNEPNDIETVCNRVKPLEQFLDFKKSKFEKQGYTFPLTESSIRASYQNHRTSWYRFHKALKKMLSGESMQILVLGGSFTAGQPPCDRKRAWTVELERLLKSLVNPKIKVTNLAVPGTTSMDSLQSWPKLVAAIKGSDLIIDEHNFNDSFEGRPGDIKGAASGVVFNVLNMSHKPAFMHLDLPNWRKQEAELNKSVSDPKGSAHFEVAKSFQTPLIWYVDAVKHSGTLGMDMLEHPRNFPERHHPKCFPAHENVASLVYGMMRLEMQEICDHDIMENDAPLPELGRSDPTVSCAIHHKFAAYPEMGSQSFRVNSTNGWSFFEDVPGKPGWIAASGGVQRDIVFKLPVQRGVLIEFLRSYEGLGSATCQLESLSAGTRPQGTKLTMHGLWDQCASLTQTMTLQIESTPQSITEQKGEAKMEEYLLRCRSDGGKFKITSILSC